ncbi:MULTISPECIES: hypothetical protein [Rhizobium]
MAGDAIGQRHDRLEPLLFGNAESAMSAQLSAPQTIAAMAMNRIDISG